MDQEVPGSRPGGGTISLISLRAPETGECAALSALCLRSKAHWGYDAAFMAACVPVLTIKAADLARMTWQVAEVAGEVAGVAAIRFEGTTAHLDKLFVDPDAMGVGAGGALMRWALEAARGAGAVRIQIESDPQAVLFYTRYGAVQVGEVASEAIAGRVLPLLEVAL